MSALVEPASVTSAPGATTGAMVRHTLSIWPTGGASKTKSAPVAATTKSAVAQSQAPTATAFSSVAARRPTPTISRAQPQRRAAKPNEPPMRPMPTMARRLNINPEKWDTNLRSQRLRSRRLGRHDALRATQILFQWCSAKPIVSRCDRRLASHFNLYKLRPTALAIGARLCIKSPNCATSSVCWPSLSASSGCG